MTPCPPRLAALLAKLAAKAAQHPPPADGDDRHAMEVSQETKNRTGAPLCPR